VCVFHWLRFSWFLYFISFSFIFHWFRYFLDGHFVASCSFHISFSSRLFKDDISIFRLRLLIFPRYTISITEGHFSDFLFWLIEAVASLINIFSFIATFRHFAAARNICVVSIFDWLFSWATSSMWLPDVGRWFHFFDFARPIILRLFDWFFSLLWWFSRRVGPQAFHYRLIYFDYANIFFSRWFSFSSRRGWLFSPAFLASWLRMMWGRLFLSMLYFIYFHFRFLSDYYFVSFRCWFFFFFFSLRLLTCEMSWFRCDYHFFLSSFHFVDFFQDCRVWFHIFFDW